MRKKKSFKIFHINESGAPTGGAELYIIFLYKALTRLGHSVTLIYNRWEPNTFLGENGDVYFLRGIDSYENDLVAKKALKRLKMLIQEKNPDLIHVHNLGNPLMIRKIFMLAPIVKSVHDYRLICPMEFKMKPNGTLCQERTGAACLECMAQFGIRPDTAKKRLSCKLKEIEVNRDLSQIIAGSQYVKKQLALNGFSDKKISLLPYFVLKKPCSKKPTGLTNKKNVLFIARGIEGKGLIALLKTFALLKNKEVTLTVIGSGSALSEGKEYADKLKISSRINFTGWVKHNLLDSYYQKCSLLVIPSLWPEPFGLVGLDAMIFRKPVVAFDVGGISDWLEDGETGFLVERGNTKLLAEKIDLLLSDSNLASKLGQKGYERVREKFMARTHVLKLIEIYKDLAKKRLK